ncbi:MAG: hypothetical protein ACYCV7_05450 [Acidimicrobiales bacterium]
MMSSDQRPRRGRPSKRRRLRATHLTLRIAMVGCASVFGLAVIPPLAHATATTSTSTSTTTSTTTTGSGTTTATGSGPAPAYWLVGSNGSVFPFGGLPNDGSMAGQHLDKPIVGMAATPNAGGYWLVASDGGVFTFGNAPFHGSMGGIRLNKPIVGMAATRNGGGYWLVASDGGIFSFGNANFFGSTGSFTLNKPIVGMAATRNGGGYWLVASDGGVFAFGDARFHGSTGAMTLNKPIVGMAATPNGGGYWLVASDGGVFAFGDAPYRGSTGGETLSRPIVASAADPTGYGYWFSDSGGLVFNFGSAGYFGSAPSKLSAPIVGMAIGPGTGSYESPSISSGSYGYDISTYQCGHLPPPPHQIGIVEVDGGSSGYLNPCLAQEAAWAGAGLNLYTYLTYALATTGPAICNGSEQDSCYAGYAASQHAFNDAQSAGITTSVTWWLDVENDPSWSSDLKANAAFVKGAVDGLRAKGVNNVGIYTSVLTWAGIVGSYTPQLPLWAAWYTGHPHSNCVNAYSYASSKGVNLPSGGVWLTQYTNSAGGYDGDYAC